MHQYNFNISNVNELKGILQVGILRQELNYQSVFVQIYSAFTHSGWYLELTNEIKHVYPDSVVVGASSVGEISEGRIHKNSTVVIFSFFESSRLHLFAHDCELGEEEKVANLLIESSKLLDTDVKGMLLLSTTTSNNSGIFFNTLTASTPEFPIFGGGAGDYDNNNQSLVFDGEAHYNAGVVAVCFLGENLHINILDSLGWQPLSKEMTITEVINDVVKTIDEMPAFSVYEKYLGIKADSNFFLNSLEFPFIIKRGDQNIARTPFFANEENQSIHFIGDLKVGEKFRIGYGNLQTIQDEATQLHYQMNDFKPEAIFLYTCICRRFLMQDEVNFETLPFNDIAPTAGFYTFGEFFSDKSFQALLNSTIVTVGMREGDSTQKPEEYDKPIITNSRSDPYTHQHNRILSRLLFFIRVLIGELEDKGQNLKSLNEQKNEFLGIVAHDLRNPISTIRGFSKLLKDVQGEKAKKFASIIFDETSNMMNLLNDLLDVSKIEAGRLELKLIDVDYIKFVQRNVKLNKLFAQKKKISISVVCKMQSQTLPIDKSKITQVLNNLIGNAIKFSYPGSAIKIKVFGTATKVITQVKDHGQGIPEDEINNIFRIYERTSVQPTAGEDSHGIGLAIVKKIIEAHNGEISVKSTYGEGASFYFSLPIDQNPDIIEK